MVITLPLPKKGIVSKFDIVGDVHCGNNKSNSVVKTMKDSIF